MRDHFALFGERRAAWLDVDSLKHKFHESARRQHPDAGGTSFEELNTAYRVLADPKSRLAHLLELNGAKSAAITQPPPDFVELFFETANALKASKPAMEDHRARLTAERERVIESLRMIDARDNRQLGAAHERLAFLDRWIAQLNEALV